jgi:hypothetical protein
MRRTIFVVLVAVFGMTVLAGCSTTTHTRERLEKVDESFYEPTGPREAQFTLITENGIQGIQLTYSQVFEEYRVTGERVYEVEYEATSGLIGSTVVAGSEREKIKRNQTRETKTRNQKTEQAMPEDGTEVIFSLGNNVNKAAATATAKGGKVMFTDELQVKILEAIQDLTTLKTIQISIPSLARRVESLGRMIGVISYIDITTIDFMKARHTEVADLVKAVPQTNINTPVAFETFANAITSLKTRLQYPFQLNLLRQEIEKAQNELTDKLKADKKVITDAIPEYFIEGEITDSLDLGNATVYQIWGIAQPIGANAGNRNIMDAEGFRTHKSNLWVSINKNVKMETDTIQRFASHIIIMRGVYYTSRDYGKNSNGQQVPIFNYSNDMTQVPNVGNRKQQLDALNAQLAAISETGKRYLTELN